jgi:hypothetical protein
LNNGSTYSLHENPTHSNLYPQPAGGSYSAAATSAQDLNAMSAQQDRYANIENPNQSYNSPWLEKEQSRGKKSKMIVRVIPPFPHKVKQR